MNLNARQVVDITRTDQFPTGFPLLPLHGLFLGRELLTEGKACSRGEEHAHAAEGEPTGHRPTGPSQGHSKQTQDTLLTFSR